MYHPVATQSHFEQIYLYSRLLPIPKPASDYMEHYQQAVEHVTEHRGITVGTIMRLYQLSAINACEIFQQLMDNEVINGSGRLYRKEKKEL